MWPVVASAVEGLALISISGTLGVWQSVMRGGGLPLSGLLLFCRAGKALKGRGLRWERRARRPSAPAATVRIKIYQAVHCAALTTTHDPVSSSLHFGNAAKAARVQMRHLDSLLVMRTPLHDWMQENEEKADPTPLCSPHLHSVSSARSFEWTEGGAEELASSGREALCQSSTLLPLSPTPCPSRRMRRCSLSEHHSPPPRSALPLSTTPCQEERSREEAGLKAVGNESLTGIGEEVRRRKRRRRRRWRRRWR